MKKCDARIRNFKKRWKFNPNNSNINNINNGKKHNNNRYDRLLTSSMDWTVKLYVIHIYILPFTCKYLSIYIYYTIILFTI